MSAAARNHRGEEWRSRAVFRADSRGTVDLGRARPLSGTYTGIDGMGLFWSMALPTGDRLFHPPPPEEQPAYDI